MKKKCVCIVAVALITLVFMACNFERFESENTKKQKIAEYLISPEKNPLEVFDYIERAYGKKEFFNIVAEWGLMDYYNMIYGKTEDVDAVSELGYDGYHKLIENYKG